MSEMKQIEKAEIVSHLLKTIANPVRLLLLCLLLDKQHNVSEMLEKIDISQSALSQHLAILKKEDIIKSQKQGKYIYYSIKDQKTIDILAFLEKTCCNADLKH